MKVTIEITAHSLPTLLKELDNIRENIGRYSRFDAMRTHKEGHAKVLLEGKPAKFAVVDENDEYVSFHMTRTEANAACTGEYEVIDLEKCL